MTVSKADRDKLLDTTSAAIQKNQAAQDWAKNHPNLQQDLGADFQRYNELQTNLQALGTNAQIAIQKFSSADPATWATITAQEWNDASTWSMFAEELYNITLKHPTVVPKPAAKPGVPAAASAGPSPLVIGVGAAAVVGLLAVALS